MMKEFVVRFGDFLNRSGLAYPKHHQFDADPNHNGRGGGSPGLQRETSAEFHRHPSETGRALARMEQKKMQHGLMMLIGAASINHAPKAPPSLRAAMSASACPIPTSLRHRYALLTPAPLQPRGEVHAPWQSRQMPSLEVIPKAAGLKWGLFARPCVVARSATGISRSDSILSIFSSDCFDINSNIIGSISALSSRLSDADFCLKGAKPGVRSQKRRHCSSFVITNPIHASAPDGGIFRAANKPAIDYLAGATLSALWHWMRVPPSSKALPRPSRNRRGHPRRTGVAARSKPQR